MSDLRKLLADAGAWIANSEVPGSAEVAADIEAALAATTDEPRLREALEREQARLDRLEAAFDDTLLTHDVAYEDFAEIARTVFRERWLEAREARAALRIPDTEER